MFSKELLDKHRYKDVPTLLVTVEERQIFDSLVLDKIAPGKAKQLFIQVKHYKEDEYRPTEYSIYGYRDETDSEVSYRLSIEYSKFKELKKMFNE